MAAPAADPPGPPERQRTDAAPAAAAPGELPTAQDFGEKAATEVTKDNVEAVVNLALARGSDKVGRHIDGKQVVKEIVVPGKLVNLVVN